MSEKATAAEMVLSVESGHEDRIQRLETTSQETAVRLEGVATSQGYLAEQLHDFRTDLSNRLDSGFGKLAAFDERVTLTLESHGKLIGTYGDRLVPLESDCQERKEAALERKSTVKKIVIGCILAASGVFATKGVELLWTWLSP